MIRIFIIVILVGGTNWLFSQNLEVDSLKKAISNCNGKAQLQAFEQICYGDKLESDEKINYAHRWLKEARNQKNVDSEIQALNRLGVIHTHNLDHDSSLFYRNKLILLAKQKDLNNQLGKAYRDISLTYAFIHNYNPNNENRNRIFIYLDSALLFCAKAKDTTELINIYTSKSDIFMEENNEAAADSVFLFAKEIADVASKNLIAPAYYIHLGHHYRYHGDLDKAIEQMKFAQNEYQKKSRYDWVAYTDAEIGKIHDLKGDPITALKYYDQGIKVAKLYNKYNELLMNLNAKHDTYKKMGRFEDALSTYVEFIRLRDSLKGDPAIEAIEKSKTIEEKLRAQEKMNEALLKEAATDKENARQSKNLTIAIASSGGLLSIGLLLFILLRRNRRSLAEANEQRERAERSEDVKRRFLANMSHEIRTPMNAVTGMTSLVLETDLDEKQRSYLEKVRKSSDNLLQIINDILDFSKIEVGKMELEEIDFSIKEVVDQVKQVVKHKADEKGLELIVNIDPKVEDIVLGDPLRLNQVLINLAGNAIKFTEKGSVTMEVIKMGDQVKFAVMDTGIGIPPEKLRFVFDSFNQANASDTRKYGGTGLGLSISQQLVELMGGSIGIESEEGRGTTFHFEVQFKPGDKQRYQERLADDMNIDGSILDGLKIMIADDNEYNRIVARDMLLSRANVEIVEAKNGQDAIDQLDETIDVILMDGQMPVMNGFDATRQIRSSENIKLRTMPIIAFTASVMRGDLDKCRDAGMDGFIPKPFKFQDLIKGIASELKIELRHLNPETNESKATAKVKSGKVADLNYLTGFCEGDREKMKKYIDIFLKSVPSIIEILDEADEANDLRTIADQIHGYKTKLIMMGMAETKELAVELEILCREKGDRKKINEILGIIKVQLRTAVEELNAFSA